MANYYASLPYNYLKLLQTPPRYSLVLAPDVVANTNFYLSAYNRTRMGTPIYGVIVDSGVVEKLEFTNEMIIEAAKIVSATKIILPDVFGSADSTIHRIEEFLRRYQNTTVGRNTELIGVVQGKTPNEIFECLNDLLRMPINGIGIPYRLQSVVPRLEIAARIKMFCRKQVHYLGIQDVIEDILDCRMFEKYVDSIDSAVPVTMGFNGLEITPATTNILPEIRNRWLVPNPNVAKALKNIAAVSLYCQRMEIQ